MRRELAARRVWLTVKPTDQALYLHGAVSMRRICPMSPADARRIGLAEGAIVELVAPRAAPPRAWMVINDTVEAGSVPLAPLARRRLGAPAAKPLPVRWL